MTPTILSLLIWWVAIIGTLIMQRISQAWKAYAIYAAIIATLFTIFISWLYENFQYNRVL
nr:MAG TPA: hypothetical protein [Caudoviricetes sp.]